MTLKDRGPLSEARWGYCRYCGRDVEIRASGRLGPHTRHGNNSLNNWAEVTCEGAYTSPTKPPREEGGEDAETASDPVS